MPGIPISVIQAIFEAYPGHLQDSPSSLGPSNCSNDREVAYFDATKACKQCFLAKRFMNASNKQLPSMVYQPFSPWPAHLVITLATGVQAGVCCRVQAARAQVPRLHSHPAQRQRHPHAAAQGWHARRLRPHPVPLLAVPGCAGRCLQGLQGAGHVH